jgi:hypothetical protein
MENESFQLLSDRMELAYEKLIYPSYDLFTVVATCLMYMVNDNFEINLSRTFFLVVKIKAEWPCSMLATIRVRAHVFDRWKSFQSSRRLGIWLVNIKYRCTDVLDLRKLHFSSSMCLTPPMPRGIPIDI